MKKLLFLIMCIAALALVACGGNEESAAEEREGFLTLSVSGMTCPRCESVVERELARVDGVISVSAYNRRNEVVIEHTPEADLDAIRRAIVLEGFTVN